MEYILSKFLGHGFHQKKKKEDGTSIEHRQNFGMDTHLSKI